MPVITRPYVVRFSQYIVTTVKASPVRLRTLRLVRPSQCVVTAVQLSSAGLTSAIKTMTF